MAVAALRQGEDGALHLLSPAQILDHGLFAGRVEERRRQVAKAATLPPEAQAVTRVAWGPAVGPAAWLASAGAAGVVRCQWVAGG